MTTPLTVDDPPLVGSFRLISRFSVDERDVTYLATTAGGNDVLLTLYTDQPDEAELEGAFKVSPFGKQVCVVRAYSGPPLPEKKMRTARTWDLKVVALSIVGAFGFCGLTATGWAHFIVTEKPLAPPFYGVTATDPQVTAWASPDGSEVRLLLMYGDTCKQKAKVRIEERPDVLVLAVRVNDPECRSEDLFPRSSCQCRSTSHSAPAVWWERTAAPTRWSSGSPRDGRSSSSGKRGHVDQLHRTLAIGG